MGKKLTPVDQYYIDNHPTVSPETLAKQIGCTARTIYNYKAKKKGQARTEEGRNEIKGVKPTEATPVEIPTQPQNSRVPIAMSNLIQRGKNATAMTKAAAELADETIDRSGPPLKDPSYIHVINKDKGQ